MSSALTKLNLRPQERRLVVFVASVVFVVLNIWLVWPHFADWTQTQIRLEREQKTLDSYNAEIAKTKAYQVKLRELESAGQPVVPEEQELDLVRTVNTQTREAGLNVLGFDPRPRASNTQTNQFFEEMYETVHATSDNEQLIKFLMSLTATNSLIRVKDLSLRLADASGTRLDATMTLVASYQRTKPIKNQPQLAAQPQTSRPATNLAATKSPAKTAPATSLAKTNKSGAAALAAVLSNKLAGAKSRLTNPPALKGPGTPPAR